MKNIASWKLILLGVMASACGGNMEKEYEQAKLTAEAVSYTHLTLPTKLEV